jgi:uncharacterized protein DUF4124
VKRLVRAFLPCLLLAALSGVQAQTLYKWTDAQGKVQYSDRPPKNFDGPVTKIEPDQQPTPTPVPVAPKAAPPTEASKANEDSLAGMAARKREMRERLGANVERARARVEAARKALDEAKDVPGDDDRQIIQQRVAGPGNRGTPQGLPNPDTTQARTTGGGMHGMTARSNCRDAKSADGKTVTICPSSVLKPEYFERIEKLEEELRKAEAELELAQEIYRRNVD